MPEPTVVIVDYALGNLYSIHHACTRAGLAPVITSDRTQILQADAVLLPGMGAFGDAMRTLRQLDLVEVLRDVAASGRPLIGICLGIQLLLSESHEFGTHRGLDIIAGSVVRLDKPRVGDKMLKVPQIGWNQINPARPWKATLLDGVPAGEYMYFVHSYVPCPDDDGVVLSYTDYGGVKFCSCIQKDNIFACLFHPERSAKMGLKIYQNLAGLIRQSMEGNHR